MLREVLIVLVMLSSVLVGWLLAYLTREELVAGRKWFKLIILMCVVVIIGLLLTRVDYYLEMTLGLIYLGILASVSLKLSFNKKFVK